MCMGHHSIRVGIIALCALAGAASALLSIYSFATGALFLFVVATGVAAMLLSWAILLWQAEPRAGPFGW